MTYCPACDKPTIEINNEDDDIEIRCTSCGYEFD